MHEMSNLFSGGRKQNISKWHLLKFLKITHKVTADQVMQLCYAFFVGLMAHILCNFYAFLCFPKGEHIVAALAVRPCVTLLSGAYL